MMRQENDDTYCSTTMERTARGSSKTIKGTIGGSSTKIASGRLAEIESLAISCGLDPSECALEDLQDCQIDAITYVHTQAVGKSGEARKRMLQKASYAGLTAQDLEQVETYLRVKCPMTIKINPQSLLPYLIKDPYYRSCFEVGTKGSDYLDTRARWETTLFNGAYDKVGVSPADKSKYGCLNVVCNPDSDTRANCYGSSYLLLNNTVRPRVTISTSKEKDGGIFRNVGNLSQCWHIVETFGQHELRRLVDVATNKRNMATVSNQLNGGDAASGNYKELQIHGMVDMRRDVGALVMASNDQAEQLAKEFGKQYHVPVVSAEKLKSFLADSRWSVAVKRNNEATTVRY